MKGERSLENKDEFFPDLLRAVAIVLVVIHHSLEWYLQSAGQELYSWWVGLGLYSVAKEGVPLFIMLSGMLLLNKKDEDMYVFFKKRFVRVIVPFAAWSIISSWLSKLLGEGTYYSDNIFLDIVSGNVFPHLWFIYVIIGLYISTPILRIYISGAKNRDILYFIGICILVNSFIPSIKVICKIDVGLTEILTTKYLCYFLIGYYVEQNKNRINSLTNILVSLFIGFILLAMLTNYLFVTSPTIPLSIFFSSLLSPVNIIFSLLIYLLIILCSARYSFSCLNTNIIKFVSDASYGVYLVHLLLVIPLRKKSFVSYFDWLPVNSFGYVLVVFVGSFFGSLLVVHCLRSIPYLKTISGYSGRRRRQ